MQHRAFVSKTVFKQLDLLYRWLCEGARWIKSCVLIGYLARSAFPSFFPTRKTNSFSQSFLTQLRWLSFGFRTFLRPLMVRGSQTVLTVAATGNVPFHFLLIIPCDLCRWFLNGKVSEEHSSEWICQAMVLCPSQILRPLWTSFNSLCTKRISFIFSPCLMKTWQGEYLMRNLWGVHWACRLLPPGNCKSILFL